MSDIAAAEKPVIVDVWSRTSPKYRVRAVLMLSLVALLFGGLCCFTYWLRTGDVEPWSSDEYGDIMMRSLRPAGKAQVTLSDFLTAPISVKEVPVHGVIMGLLFATLTSIPILVAILYRFPSSVLFSAMVIFLASMPWLGITVLAGCVLASWPRFRFSFRYASALVGLIPVGFYFVMASWEPAGTTSRSVENLALLYAPWVLALLSSCVICAVTLASAKLINYRPGGITPVMALLFAIPVVLFHTRVGRDELEYRILEGHVGPGAESYFQPLDVEAEADHEATRNWSRSGERSFDEVRRPLLIRAMESVQADVETDRTSASADCDSFLERFPRSKYVPNVLFLKGQVLDHRINRSKLRGQHRVEFRTDFPSTASQQVWRTLEKEFPNHQLTAMALYKLAWIQGRSGRLNEARELLQQLIARFDPGAPTTRPAGAEATSHSSIFDRLSPIQRLEFDREVLIKQARRLSDLLASCIADASKPAAEVFGARRGDAFAPVHPLALLLSLDETDPNYTANLQGIIRHFYDSQTARYAEIRLVLMEVGVSRKISRLRTLAESLSGRASGAEAMFRLAELLQEDSVSEESKAVMEELIRAYPGSSWADEAKARMASLNLADRTTG